MGLNGRPRDYHPDRAATVSERQARWRRAERERRQQTSHALQQQLKVYHRSLTVEWATPQAFFDRYHAEFVFTLDVCATPANAKCSRYYT